VEREKIREGKTFIVGCNATCVTSMDASSLVDASSLDSSDSTVVEYFLLP
jgi:hypothetical protein